MDFAQLGQQTHGVQSVVLGRVREFFDQRMIAKLLYALEFLHGLLRLRS